MIERDRMETLIRKTYQEFIRKLSNNPTFVYKADSKEESCINTFLKILKKEYGLESIGSAFIYNYFCFQLNYWKDMDTRFGKKIPISWFIGKKAFERWLVNPEQDLWHAHQTADELGLYIDSIDTVNTTIVGISEITVSEEKEKERFYNTKRGFLNCIESTTLYNHNSNFCISCKFKKECMDLLRDNFYRIYLKRGYGEKNKSKAG